MQNRCGLKENLSKDERSELLRFFTAEYHPLVAFGQQCGLGALEVLLDLLGGEKPHIPTSGNFWRHLAMVARDEDIRLRFVGNNYRELAVDYVLDERHIRRIVQKESSPRLKAAGVTCSAQEDLTQELVRRCGRNRDEVVSVLVAIALALPGIGDQVSGLLPDRRAEPERRAEAVTCFGRPNS